MKKHIKEMVLILIVIVCCVIALEYSSNKGCRITYADGSNMAKICDSPDNHMQLTGE